MSESAYMNALEHEFLIPWNCEVTNMRLKKGSYNWTILYYGGFQLFGTFANEIKYFW